MRKLSLMIVLACFATACGAETAAMSPDELQQRYGVTGAYSGTFATPEGAIKGTVIPVTLADGREAQLVIPSQRRAEPHAVYIRDAEGFHPVQIQENANRTEVVQSPAVVSRRAEPAHPRKRSWEKEALIIGGSAGGGALIGAVAGGKKGAAIGATAGGVGGLIYDLATRDK